MLYGNKSREELNEYAEKVFRTHKEVKNRKLRRNLFDEIENHFGINSATIDSMITFKRDIKEFTNFEIFAVMWFLDRDNLDKFFTQTEIDDFSHEKIVEEKIEFPLIFKNAIKITDNQFMISTDLQELMRYRRARMLNYDANEQRALRRVKFGKTEIYKPFVNNVSVGQIKDKILAGDYVPDPLTFNMGDDAEYSFDDGTLVVSYITKGMFNLDDGYHRYLAMSQINDDDPKFNYPVVIQIVAFSNSKAVQFIYQQDQKNRMKKIVSDTYDLNAVPNLIVNRVNEDPGFALNGMIGRNHALINSAVLAKLVAYFYHTKSIKKSDVKEINRIKTELVNKFNIIAANDRFLGAYDEPTLFAALYIFNSGIPKNTYIEVISSIVDNLTPVERRYFSIAPTGSVRRIAMNIKKEKIKPWLTTTEKEGADVQ